MSKSYAQNTNYYAVFGNEKLNDVKLYLNELTLPGITVITDEVKNRYASLKFLNGELIFNDIVLNVLCDENFDLYTNMMDLIFEQKDVNTGTVTLKPFNMSIFITSNKGNVIKRFDYHDCIIFSIGDINFRDAETAVMNVSIKYTYVTYTNITNS